MDSPWESLEIMHVLQLLFQKAGVLPLSPAVLWAEVCADTFISQLRLWQVLVYGCGTKPMKQCRQRCRISTASASSRNLRKCLFVCRNESLFLAFEPAFGTLHQFLNGEVRG